MLPQFLVLLAADGAAGQLGLGRAGERLAAAAA